MLVSRGQSGRVRDKVGDVRYGRDLDVAPGVCRPTRGSKVRESLGHGQLSRKFDFWKLVVWWWLAMWLLGLGDGLSVHASYQPRIHSVTVPRAAPLSGRRSQGV
jgi:hypothetical protein